VLGRGLPYSTPAPLTRSKAARNNSASVGIGQASAVLNTDLSIAASRTSASAATAVISRAIVPLRLPINRTVEKNLDVTTMNPAWGSPGTQIFRQRVSGSCRVRSPQLAGVVSFPSLRIGSLFVADLVTVGLRRVLVAYVVAHRALFLPVDRLVRRVQGGSWGYSASCCRFCLRIGSLFVADLVMVGSRRVLVAYLVAHSALFPSS
jgi:hypothetical protein